MLILPYFPQGVETKESSNGLVRLMENPYEHYGCQHKIMRADCLEFFRQFDTDDASYAKHRDTLLGLACGDYVDETLSAKVHELVETYPAFKAYVEFVWLYYEYPGKTLAQECVDILVTEIRDAIAKYDKRYDRMSGIKIIGAFDGYFWVSPRYTSASPEFKEVIPVAK